MSGRNASQRAEQRKLREQMRGLGMSRAEIAAEMARRYKLRPRPAWRVAWGWTLEEAAERYNALRAKGTTQAVTSLTGSRLSEWENWPLSTRKPPVTGLCLLAEIYQCGVLDLIDFHDREKLTSPELLTLDKTGAAPPPVEGHPGPRSMETLSPAGMPEGLSELWEELMRRRTFLSQSGAAALMMVAPSYPVMPAPCYEAEAVAACAELTAGYRRLESVLGPGSVYAQVAEHHRHLTTWLPQVRDSASWRQLAQVTADANVLFAWLSFDLDWFDQAMLLYKQSFELARELDDVNLAAFLAGRMSRTLSESGQHQHALELAEMAWKIAGTAAIPALRSWLAVTRGYVHACLNDERSCRDALTAASALLGRSGDPAPPYLAFYGEPYLNKWSGHALLALAERKAPAATAEGRAAVDHALAIWSQNEVRESGEVLVAAARARLAQREIDEASQLVARARDIATATGSPRIMRYVTGIRQQLRPWPGAEAAAGLDERTPPGN